MRRCLPIFSIRLFMAAMCVLMLAGPSVSNSVASPALAGDIPDGVGIYAEEADPCTPGSVIFDFFGGLIGAFLGKGSSISGTLGGEVAEEAAGEAIGKYLERGCNQAVAEIYGKVAVAYGDAYLRAEQFPASPGYPDDVGIHHWADILIQDFWGGTDPQGNLNGDGWGAIIWGGLETDSLPHYVGGSSWVAYKRAIYEPSVLGEGILPGYPTGPEHRWNRVIIQDFSGSSWGISAIIGGDQEQAWLVAGNHLQAYIDADGSNTLGNPLGPVEKNADEWYEQKFEDGIILELAGETRVQYYTDVDTPPELPAVGHEEPTEPPIESSTACNDAGIPQITDGLSYSPENPDTATQVEFSFTITNNGCGTFLPEVLAIGGRDPNGQITDPLQIRDFTLGPGESRTISQPAVLGIPGTHEFFMVFLRAGGGWNEIPDTSGVSRHIHINVTEAAAGQEGQEGQEEATSPPIQQIEPDNPQDEADVAEPDSPEVTQAPPQGNDLVPMDIGATGPNGHEIGAQFTVTTSDGGPLGSCTLEGQGDEPYLIACQVDVPRNTTVIVTLDESTITPGFAPNENPITFDTSGDPGAASYWGVVFQLESQGSTIITSQTSDVAIVTTENGQPVHDACFVLVNFSNEGCDRNADGQITFEDVPLGSYTLRQTANLGPGRSVPDSTITVSGMADGDGWERFPVEVVASSGSSSNQQSTGQSGAVDIALITRDPGDGHLLTDVCYVVGQSNEGCDRNGDGQVTFEAIPYGTYTVRQTQTPAGYPAVNDYTINVQPTGYMEGPSFGTPLGLIVRQAPEQNAPNTRNVSVVFLDMVTHERVTTGACVELIGASNVGCDRDLIDGQVDFLDVPAGGPYELSFSNLPAGAQVGESGGPLAVRVDASAGSPVNEFVFVLLAMPGSGSGSGDSQEANNQAANDQIISVQEDDPGSESGENTQPVAPQNDAQSSGSATMLMTFLACPEEFNPSTGDFFAECTIPLDAPDASFIYWGVKF